MRRMKSRRGHKTPRRWPNASARARRAGTKFARLVRIMDTLRSPRGCPWDREQTHDTLKPFLIEETYEAIDAIDRGDIDDLRGELGDVLFQCVFHGQIAAESGRFDIAGIVQAIIDKLIRRHPHVFTPAGRPLPARSRTASNASTPTAVLEQWEKLKAREQSDAGKPKRVLSGLPKALPALVGAHEIGTRVASVGFDWPTAQDVVAKIDEEVRELASALEESPARAAEEMGDLLFSIANLARKLNVEPESALRAANEKFSRRFDMLQLDLESSGRNVHDASQAEMEEAWTRVKKASSSPALPTRARRSSAAAPRVRRSRR
jgi:ATP diphosphatase